MKEGVNLEYNPFISKKHRSRKKLTDKIFSLEEAPGDILEVGYLSVSVSSASGALPVADAAVTVYIYDENGEENNIAYYISDANGQVPTITLPVIYNPLDPLESGEYYFTTYNLRVQAINYYTVNVVDLRVFPDITTYFQIDMIPVAVGPTEGPDRTVIIPPSPIDFSND